MEINVALHLFSIGHLKLPRVMQNEKNVNLIQVWPREVNTGSKMSVVTKNAHKIIHLRTANKSAIFFKEFLKLTIEIWLGPNKN